MTLNTEKITSALERRLGVDGFRSRLAELKSLNLNPFSTRDDGTRQGYADLLRAQKIVSDLAHNGVVAVEALSADAVHMKEGTPTGREKLDSLVEFLDDCVELPFWAEPFDDLAFRLMVTAMVNQLDVLLGKNWTTVVDTLNEKL